MIGYYVHHHGRGHLHRALALAAGLDEPVTVLSSLARPEGWDGAWVRLPMDAADDDPPAREATAGGALHWAPLHQPGLRRRAALVSAWLERARPRLVVCDVSQEVALLVRLHGTPVVSVVLPGRRDDDAHRTGLRASSAICSFWPATATRMLHGLPDDVSARLQPLGAMSRWAPVDRPAQRRAGPRRLVVLGGTGGDAWTAAQAADLDAAASAAGWSVRVVGVGGDWVDDPWPLLLDADVVVVQAGQNAVAEVAAARVPAVVLAGDRPFAEQAHTAAQLDTGPWPAVSLPRLAHDDWPGLLDRVAGLDGRAWSSWCDGGAARRFAALVGAVDEGRAA